MIHEEKIMFKVGKNNKDDYEKIELEGLVLSKSTPSSGTVVFSQGISGHFKDCENILFPLAEEFDVITFNQRGHGKSEGRFDPMKMGDDLDEITYDGSFILGLSAGAVGALTMETDVASIFLINPYLGPDFLSKKQRFCLYAAKCLSYTGIQKIIQYLFSIKDLNKKSGFHNKRFIDDYAKLTKVPEFYLNKKVGFCVADKDEVLGTLNNEEHYNNIINKFSIFYDATDYSHIAKGLNHCLNKKKKDFAPFLKDETGKDSNKIIETIIEFYKQEQFL